MVAPVKVRFSKPVTAVAKAEVPDAVAAFAADIEIVSLVPEPEVIAPPAPRADTETVTLLLPVPTLTDLVVAPTVSVSFPVPPV